ncbi:MAG: hypothetical protein ABEH43_09230 [Flavobacteriales bacterium]
MSTKKHKAGNSFIKDQNKYWKELKVLEDSAVFNDYPLWFSKSPGEKIFTLNPSVQVNEQFGNVPEPDTRHYLHKDIYTHIRFASLDKGKKENFKEFEEFEATYGDTMFAKNYIAVLDTVKGVKKSEYDKYDLKSNDVALKAVIKILTDKNENYKANPLFVIRNDRHFINNTTVMKEAGFKLRFKMIKPDKNKFTFEIAREKADKKKDVIVMQAIVFPFINLLWMGCVVMVLGTALALVNRLKRISND